MPCRPSRRPSALSSVGLSQTASSFQAKLRLIDSAQSVRMFRGSRSWQRRPRRDWLRYADCLHVCNVVRFQVPLSGLTACRSLPCLPPNRLTPVRINFAIQTPPPNRLTRREFLLHSPSNHADDIPPYVPFWGHGDARVARFIQATDSTGSHRHAAWRSSDAIWPQAGVSLHRTSLCPDLFGDPMKESNSSLCRGRMFQHRRKRADTNACRKNAAIFFGRPASAMKKPTCWS